MPVVSRYIRPAEPSAGLLLQSRDLDILRSVYQHRFVRSDHLHRLLFAGVSLRALQVRLRKLWEHHYLDRYFQPFVLGEGHHSPTRATQPIYTLGRRGAEEVAELLGVARDEIPHGFRHNGLGLPALHHHLVVTDFLVAVVVSARGCTDITLHEIKSGFTLARTASLWKRRTQAPHQYVIPDGAVTLSIGGQRMTYYLEVVRAGVSGGNKRLIEKLRRYVSLNRLGFFKQAFGHERLRAVIFATTSDDRSDRLRAVARPLVHGRHLFWFGSYEAKQRDGNRQSTLAPESIFSPRWRTVDGVLRSLLPPGVPRGEPAVTSSTSICLRSPQKETPPAS